MDLERKLYNLGLPLSSREFLTYTILATALLFGSLYFFLPSYAPSALFLPIIAYILVDYLHERKISKIEAELPRFIHLLSTYPNLTLKDVIRLGSSGFGELSSEFRGMKRLVESGSPASRVLLSFARRTGSPLIGRVVEGLVTAFRSGGTEKLLKNLSEELYFLSELENERRGAISLQRYSIILSASLLVPFILGLVVAVVRRLGASSSPVLPLIPTYIGMLAFISGLFLAWTEGKPKNAAVYILVTLAIGLLTYSVVTWLY